METILFSHNTVALQLITLATVQELFCWLIKSLLKNNEQERNVSGGVSCELWSQSEDIVERKYFDNLFSEVEVMIFVQECDDTSLSLSSATTPTRLQNCHPPRQPDYNNQSQWICCKPFALQPLRLAMWFEDKNKSKRSKPYFWKHGKQLEKGLKQTGGSGSFYRFYEYQW